jgi:hypothetical protein
LAGHQVVDIRLIFRVVPSITPLKPGVSDRFLAYVQRFDIIPQPSAIGSSLKGQFPEPASSLYLLKRAKRIDGSLIGDIIPLDQIRALADLIPQFGQKANRSLTRENIHSLSSGFRLNKYFDKELYLALSPTAS